MTSLLPPLPDSPRLPASEALAGGPAALPAPGAAASDFAGLVEAFAAPPYAAPTAATPEAGLAALAKGIDAEGARTADPDAALPIAATARAALPTGKNLPEPGALLPPALPPELPPATAAAEADEAALVSRQPAPFAEEGAPSAPSPAPPPAAALAVSAARSDIAGPPAPHAAGQIAGLAKSAPRHSAPGLADQALPEAAVPGGNPGRIGDTATEQPDDAAETAALAAPPLAADASGARPDPALLPLVLAITPMPAPAADGFAQTAPPRAATVSLAAAEPGPQTAPVGNRALRAAAAGPLAPASVAEPVPAPPPETSLAVAQDAGAAPDRETPATASAAPAAAAPTAAASAQALPERTAETRSAPAAHAGPQLESAIAQVGDIRAALRSVRPAMTLQHAEFGAVSIRLEPAAPDQWRAVLASRDPGFVPAIHAALAERAVTATADTSGNFSGHSGSHQNGTADQRYGSSPNGGQGSPQPYLGQSGSRDGEAAPDHRRPSTAAALAARGMGEAEDPAASTPGSGGLFA